MTSLKKNNHNKRIVLGMSGGVDSTTAALLLLKEGYEVYGLYFNIKENGEAGRAAALRALSEVYAACNVGISSLEVENKYFIYRDVNKMFNDIVVNDFCTEYLNGRTPNPCIVCNPNIKFRLLLDAADEVGADFIATGHYADTAYDDESSVSYIKAAVSRKDQSYMLYRLPQEIVSRIIFPLAKFADKSEIREIAGNMGMSNADLSDSQEICFIANDTNYAEYIAEWAGKCACNYEVKACNECNEAGLINIAALCAGNFVDKDGNVLGKHKGIVNYTIGQRKGLGIALGKPVFVTDIDAVNNSVVLGDNEELFKNHAVIDNLFFSETNGSDIPEGIEERELTAKVRYAAPRAAARAKRYVESCDANPAAFSSNNNLLEVVFETPQRAMTPGQSVVLYDGDLVIGGGRIIKTC